MDLRVIGSAILMAVFGIWLLYCGVSGRVATDTSGKIQMPRWIYIMSGVAVLILPVAYVAVLYWAQLSD